MCDVVSVPPAVSDVVVLVPHASVFRNNTL